MVLPVSEPWANRDFSGYDAGLGFGKERVFQRCLPDVEQFLMPPKKNPSTAPTPQKLGCMFARVFQALTLEKANRGSPRSHTIFILITTESATSSASPTKILSILPKA